jgi:hypothetical protein
MNIFRTESKIQTESGETFHEGKWDRLTPFMTAGGLILTELTDNEFDGVLNLGDSLDPLGLRGYMVALHVENPSEDDPKSVNLAALPAKDQILRHQDRYYLVKVVVQSSSCGIAVYVKRLSRLELSGFLR